MPLPRRLSSCSRMNELARRLGGPKAALDGYSASKEALFVAVVKAVAAVHLSDAIVTIWGDATDRMGLEDLLVRSGEQRRRCS